MAASDKLLASRAALQNSTLYLKWKRDNPGESSRVDLYWERGDIFPNTATAFGLHYALTADAYFDVTATMPFAPI